MENESNIDAAIIVEGAPLGILYFSQPNCSICLADKPRVQQLAQMHGIPFHSVNSLDKPAIAAHFSVMTVPVVLLIAKGKEVHREARIIDFGRLNKQMQRYQAALDSNEEPLSYASLFDQLAE